MLRNFIKISIRSFFKDKVHSAINLIGLGVGIFCSLVIILYANYELGFDRDHANKDRIYRVSTKYKTNSGLTIATALSSSGLSPQLKQTLTAVDESVRMQRYMGTVKVELGKNEEVYDEEFIFRTEPQLFEIFSYQIIDGDPITPLNQPNSIVLSKQLATRYFGSRNAINKTIVIEGEEFKVTAIMNDPQPNSDLYAEGFTSYDFSEYETWNDFDVYTYVMMKDDVRPDQRLIDGFNKLVNDNCTALKHYEMKGNIIVDLHGLRDLHFINGLADDTTKGNLSYVYILLVVGFLIITLVVINYVNLSIVKSIERTTEVGIRKTFGAHKIQLIAQFVVEAVLLTAIAFTVSIIFLLVFLPHINAYFDIKLSFNSLVQGHFLLAISITLIVVALVSAIYPAFFLSSMNINKELKAKGKLPSTRRLRKALLVIQFSISTIAIICTFIIQSQMDHIWKHDLGFEKDQVMVVNIPTYTLSREKIITLRDDLGSASINASVIGSNSYPGSVSTPWQVAWTFIKSEKVELATNTYYTDENFFNLLKIPLVNGRVFQPNENKADYRHAVVVNESMVQFMGWKDSESALGQRIVVFENYWDIIGVVKDFHYQSLNSRIKPIVIAMVNNEWPPEKKLLVKVKNKIDIKTVEKKWKEATGAPFGFSFVDSDFQKYYKNEETLNRISSYFTVMSLLLAAVGLFGLASLLSMQRTKEIGIRKILGGSPFGIISLLLKEFMALACIGYVMGAPIAWYIMASWVSQFPLQSPMNISSFLLPALIISVVTLLSTGFQILKSAMTNPVDSLRYE